MAWLPCVAGAVDLWELPPVRYSQAEATDAVAKLAADLASGKKAVVGTTALERLDFVLRELDVPVESQVLVFSKTSLQKGLISPQSPRALFYSENAYVGYVPGGDIEVIVPDSVLGPVFYLIGRDREGAMTIERDRADCMSCHGSSATESVPGLLIRSVFPADSGAPLMSMGSHQVGHDTPLSQRWGGYYVTGGSSLPHLGNRTFVDGGEAEALPGALKDLSDKFDGEKYPRPGSDIVSLMVLEHQCGMHNRLTAASMRYRRAHFLMSTLDPEADPDEGSAGRVADSEAEDIVEWLFFKDEAATGDGLEGDEAFQEAFVARFPRTKAGDSLADFRLYQRLFKNRCSYMVYSQAFHDLPPRVKSAVLVRMKAVLSGEDKRFDWLAAAERQRITAILEETLPDWTR